MTTRTDRFAHYTMGIAASLTRQITARGEVVDISLRTHATFPEDSRRGYREIREVARIWGAAKVRGFKDGFGRYERVVATFPLDN